MKRLTNWMVMVVVAFVTFACGVDDEFVQEGGDINLQADSEGADEASVPSPAEYIREGAAMHPLGAEPGAFDMSTVSGSSGSVRLETPQLPNSVMTGSPPTLPPRSVPVPEEVPPMPFPSRVQMNIGQSNASPFEIVRSSVDIDPIHPTNDGLVLASARENTCNLVGADDREVVNGTSYYPWSTVVNLKMRYGSAWYGCSGIIIHHEWVLTAGHCIFHTDTGTWADEVIVVPGNSGNSKPYGETWSDNLQSVTLWTEYADYGYDIGLVHMAEPLGWYTGTLGYGAFGDSTLAGSLNTAGYPYDYGFYTMIHGADATADAKTNIICTWLDACSGQSGSGLWLYYSDSDERYVAGVFSHLYGTCGTLNAATRITGELFDWMKGVFGECACSSGACCDGCNLLSSSHVCDEGLDVEFKCDVGDCGGTVQGREQIRYCSGSSAQCDGSLSWGDWNGEENCGSDGLCVEEWGGDAHCQECSFGCQDGGCCECSSGPCCDGCHYLSSSTTCSFILSEELRCTSEACGAEIERRVQVQQCSGGSSFCNGSIDWKEWEPAQVCDSDSVCIADGSGGASCNACPHGCQDGGCCECSSGPCCDGCHILSPSTACGPVLAEEVRCQSDACGVGIERRIQVLQCSGVSSSCDGAEVWGEWELVTTCDADAVCEDDGQGAVSCGVCDHGCQDGSCCECSDGPCCDGCQFHSVDIVCEQHVFSSLGAGEVRFCSGFSSECTGSVVFPEGPPEDPPGGPDRSRTPTGEGPPSDELIPWDGYPGQGDESGGCSANGSGATPSCATVILMPLVLLGLRLRDRFTSIRIQHSCWHASSNSSRCGGEWFAPGYTRGSP